MRLVVYVANVDLEVADDRVVDEEALRVEHLKLDVLVEQVDRRRVKVEEEHLVPVRVVCRANLLRVLERIRALDPAHGMNVVAVELTRFVHFYANLKILKLIRTLLALLVHMAAARTIAATIAFTSARIVRTSIGVQHG